MTELVLRLSRNLRLPALSSTIMASSSAIPSRFLTPSLVTSSSAASSLSSFSPSSSLRAVSTPPAHLLSLSPSSSSHEAAMEPPAWSKSTSLASYLLHRRCYGSLSPKLTSVSSSLPPASPSLLSTSSPLSESSPLSSPPSSSPLSSSPQSSSWRRSASLSDDSEVMKAINDYSRLRTEMSQWALPASSWYRVNHDDVNGNQLQHASPLFYPISPMAIPSFALSFLLEFRFYFTFMARTTFQAVRPLLAFSVMGEVVKLILSSITNGIFAFFFSFVLAFEVFYFFLQCYISYTFLTMFFTVLF